MTDSLTDWQTLKDSATQLLKKYKSGAVVTQSNLLFLHLDFLFDLIKSAEAHDFTGRSRFTIDVHRSRQN